MSDLGQPVQIKFIPFLAFVATRQRPAIDRPLKPPGKNWAKAFENRHPETGARRVTARFLVGRLWMEVAAVA